MRPVVGFVFFNRLLLLSSGWGQGPHGHPHDTEGEDNQEAEARELRHDESEDHAKDGRSEGSGVGHLLSLPEGEDAVGVALASGQEEEQ